MAYDDVFGRVDDACWSVRMERTSPVWSNLEDEKPLLNKLYKAK